MSVRRSGRERKANPRYSLDALDDDDLEGFVLPPENSDASSFELAGVEEEADDDEVVSISDGSEGAMSRQKLRNELRNEDGDDPINEMEIEMGTAAETVNVKSRATLDERIKYRQGGKSAAFKEEGRRIRGILFTNSIMSRDTTLKELAGYDDEMFQIMRTERYKHGGITTFPYRETAEQGQSGLCYPELLTDEIREHEQGKFKEWYLKRSQVMSKIQAVSPVDRKDTEQYNLTRLPPQNILLGPHDKQKLHSLNCGESISLSDAWNSSPEVAMGDSGTDNESTARFGWILNLGSRVTCLEYAPHQQGNYQFLAVGIDKGLPHGLPKVSALEAMEGFESCVQIWAFRTKTINSIVLMDMNEPPKLVHIICTKWGTIRRLAWCPFPAIRDEKEEEAEGKDNDLTSIGVLAMVSTDGYVRVVDVRVEINCVNPYVKYESAAFASKPPGTICTCLTWLSSDQIAAGCSNGYVAIWNIGACLAKTEQDDLPKDTISIPFWYHPLHTTFIVSIVAYQPYPAQYLATNAVDGKERLTSIQNPYHDTVWGSRERYLIPPLTYSPYIMGLYETDETDGLRARPLRHHPQSRAVGKGSAQIVCMDAGKVHPALIFGCADGTVTATNPMRRIFIRRLLDERIEALQQIWFKHEFVPESRMQQTSYEISLANDIESSSGAHFQPRPGVSRFLESFKVAAVTLARNQQTVKESKKRTGRPAEDEDDDDEEEAHPRPKTKKGKIKEEYEEIQISIFEEEQAVTAITWNPNVETGGWAAAGLANGLVRVEDLAL